MRRSGDDALPRRYLWHWVLLQSGKGENVEQHGLDVTLKHVVCWGGHEDMRLLVSREQDQERQEMRDRG